jgi:hypothetical protein
VTTCDGIMSALDFVKYGQLVHKLKWVIRRRKQTAWWSHGLSFLKKGKYGKKNNGQCGL